MNIDQPFFSPLRRIVLIVVLVGSSALLAQMPPHQTVLALQPGVDENGLPTQHWLKAIEKRHNAEVLTGFAKTARRYNSAETRWLQLITKKLPVWTTMVDSMRIPFSDIPAPDTVYILPGNQGGSDAFVSAPITICFNLEKLGQFYGAATSAANDDHIDRFFAHEFTHVLHKVWRRQNSQKIETPLERALWECMTEGLGNYRSLSGKWQDGNGNLSAHANKVLDRLQPIFAARMSALATANEVEADSLLKGLSTGKFERKWGALPVALWLAQEAQGNDENLRPWVNAGPSGILKLARKYLPEELQKKLPIYETN